MIVEKQVEGITDARDAKDINTAKLPKSLVPKWRAIKAILIAAKNLHNMLESVMYVVPLINFLIIRFIFRHHCPK